MRCRTCRLGPYLAAEHIVKHGLRFWFDSPGKDLRMSELSEQGRSRYTTLNRGVQLDRTGSTAICARSTGAMAWR